MIENIFYILLIAIVVYFGARLFHMLIVSGLTADTVLDMLKNLNIVPGKSEEAKKAEEENPFSHKIFFYAIALCIPVILIMSFVKW